MSLIDAAREAELLCEWIAESPHQRGSINGKAAQVAYALRTAIAAAEAQPAREPLTAFDIVDIARGTFIDFEGREMLFEGIQPWVFSACERVAKAAIERAHGIGVQP